MTKINPHIERFIYQILNLSRSYSDPRVAPAISLMLGHCLFPRHLKAMRWPDINLAAYTARVRDSKNGIVRTIQLSGLLVQQLIPLYRQKIRAARPFGKLSADSPTIDRLLKSVLERAGLLNCVPSDLTKWSASKSVEIRASMVTRCTY